MAENDVQAIRERPRGSKAGDFGIAYDTLSHAVAGGVLGYLATGGDVSEGAISLGGAVLGGIIGLVKSATIYGVLAQSSQRLGEYNARPERVFDMEVDGQRRIVVDDPQRRSTIFVQDGNGDYEKQIPRTWKF